MGGDKKAIYPTYQIPFRPLLCTFNANFIFSPLHNPFRPNPTTQAYTAEGLIGIMRPPHLHIAPPLVITEEELMDGFDRQDMALYALDEALGF